ncbi:hypothetical protein BJ508DRAFT_350533 [Ascobolus immersus RN42]|uniref:Uncharacterized protein n=1 Tax=Ascobolus immersus RN42 TaxID=1160509 RepID=A0A3N4I6N0_ASCIM|nr:hypothetical protein BJ508DRAFT_350533 [Ascobolus immersus RN42]
MMAWNYRSLLFEPQSTWPSDLPVECLSISSLLDLCKKSHTNPFYRMASISQLPEAVAPTTTEAAEIHKASVMGFAKATVITVTELGAGPDQEARSTKEDSGPEQQSDMLIATVTSLDGNRMNTSGTKRVHNADISEIAVSTGISQQHLTQKAPDDPLIARSSGLTVQQPLGQAQDATSATVSTILDEVHQNSDSILDMPITYPPSVGNPSQLNFNRHAYYDSDSGSQDTPPQVPPKDSQIAAFNNDERASYRGTGIRSSKCTANLPDNRRPQFMGQPGAHYEQSAQSEVSDEESDASNNSWSAVSDFYRSSTSRSSDFGTSSSPAQYHYDTSDTDEQGSRSPVPPVRRRKRDRFRGLFIKKHGQSSEAEFASSPSSERWLLARTGTPGKGSKGMDKWRKKRRTAFKKKAKQTVSALKSVILEPIKGFFRKKGETVTRSLGKERDMREPERRNILRKALAGTRKLARESLSAAIKKITSWKGKQKDSITAEPRSWFDRTLWGESNEEKQARKERERKEKDRKEAAALARKEAKKAAKEAKEKQKRKEKAAKEQRKRKEKAAKEQRKERERLRKEYERKSKKEKKAEKKAAKEAFMDEIEEVAKEGNLKVIKGTWLRKLPLGVVFFRSKSSTTD